MAYISPMLTNIVTAVKKASINLNRDFSEIERLQNSVKGSMDFTKIAFDKIQKGLKNELGKILPALPVVMVSEKVPQSGMFLILSGIEGLANFAHGNPEFAISAALMDGQTVLAGVVYNPARDELFFAEKGKGAFKEGFRSHERLRVAARQELDGAWLQSDRRQMMQNCRRRLSTIRCVYAMMSVSAAQRRWIWHTLRPGSWTALLLRQRCWRVWRQESCWSKKPADWFWIWSRRIRAPKICRWF